MTRRAAPLLAALALSACSGNDISIVVPETDNDGDGYLAEVDCDDNDASVYPGAEELADDDVDQDCDGLDARTVYGHRDDAGQTSLTPGFLIGNVIVTDYALELTHLGFTAREAFGEVQLALYSSDGGFLAELLAATAPAQAEQGVNEVPVTAPLVLEAGEWWVQLVSSENIPIAAGPDELVVYRELPWGEPLPDPYGVGSDYEGARISVFMKGALPE